MSGIENQNKASAKDSQAKNPTQEPAETSGTWVALLMVGLLAFMIAVELLRSKT